MVEFRRALTLIGLAIVVAGQATAGEVAKTQIFGGDADPMLSELERTGVLIDFGLTVDRPLAVTGALEEYLASALRENQKMRHRYAEYIATLETISQVESLPDPKLSYMEYLKPVETRVGPQQRSFSASQSFPWFGTLSSRAEVNREKAEAARSLFYNSALEVIAEVKKAYYDLGYLERSIAITDQHVRLLTQWEDVARIRYSAGTGPYTDVIKAQVELGILSDQLAELKDQRRPLSAVMNALLNRDLSSPVFVIDREINAELDAELAVLKERMTANNPLLAAWDHRAQESLNTDRVVKKQGSPTFTLGMNYIVTGPARMDGVVDSGEDAWMASIGVTLPIWREKYDSASRSALKRYEAAVSGKRELANNLGAALERAHYEYRDAGRKWALYRTALLPKGRQSLGAIRSAYEAGSSSFLDLIDAQRLVLEFELSQARSEFDLLIYEAIIEKLIAGPLSAAAEGN